MIKRRRYYDLNSPPEHIRKSIRPTCAAVPEAGKPESCTIKSSVQMPVEMAYKDTMRCIKGFIDIYQSEPCLWNINSKDYHNRAKKNDAAYARLVAKLKEVEPSADKDSVLNGATNDRSCK
jgi:hypothetical protein